MKSLGQKPTVAELNDMINEVMIYFVFHFSFWSMRWCFFSMINDQWGDNLLFVSFFLLINELMRWKGKKWNCMVNLVIRWTVTATARLTSTSFSQWWPRSWRRPTSRRTSGRPSGSLTRTVAGMYITVLLIAITLLLLCFCPSFFSFCKAKSLDKYIYLYLFVVHIEPEMNIQNILKSELLQNFVPVEKLMNFA